MRAKPNSNNRSTKPSRSNGKSHTVSNKGIVKKSNKESAKKSTPDLSVLRQPVDTSICGLKQAVKVFETGTPEVLHLLTYDCDVVYECKVCRNLFRSIANFISHKRIYCTLRYSRAQELQQSNKEGEDFTLILGELAQERLPTRVTARKDLTSIVDSFRGQNLKSALNSESEHNAEAHNYEKKSTTIHLEPIENTSYGVFQTIVKPDSDNLMKNQVTELHKLMAQNEVVLGPDGRILQNGSSSYVHKAKAETESAAESDLVCSSCNMKFANRKTLTKHKKLIHESVRTCYSCPCCKNYFANPWSVYRHLYKVHRKTNEQVRRLRTQIHKTDIKIDKSTTNNINSKKIATPARKKAETEIHARFQQDNKEWMDHFEDDWELQRCGGCGRKFERKAALISHAQICQKRMMACTRIKRNYQDLIISNNMNPIVAVSPLPCTKKPVPKPSPEKKIGIQVRMNYCKTGSQVSERQQTCSRSVLGDESDIEVASVDGKETLSSKEGSVFDKFLKNSSSCHISNGMDKVNCYLNNPDNILDKLHPCDVSTCKRTTIIKSSIGKSLEAKCLQLRSALEGGVSETLKSETTKLKDVESSSYFDSNTDNTSESNTSAVSSLSSQLTPSVEKGYTSRHDSCEVDESIEIKNINISRSLENLPDSEADTTSMTNGNSLHMTFNSYTSINKCPNNSDTICEEITTSVISDDAPVSESILQVDTSCLQDGEISVDQVQIESKNIIQEIELENTISILTRNQLKAICKDDIVPVNEKTPPTGTIKKFRHDAEVETATKEMTIRKLSKYIDDKLMQCRICLKTSKSLSDAYRHITTHTQWKRYECLYNGCAYKTFWKLACLRHVTMHKRGNSGSSVSLVGIISPNKWNLKILKPKTSIQPKHGVKLSRVIKKDTAPQKLAKSLVSTKLAKKLVSQKLAKAVNRLSKKPLNTTQSVKIKLKSKNISQQNTKQPKAMNSIGGKQKLLTDFKQYGPNKINGKAFLHTKKYNQAKSVEIPKKKISVNNSLQKKVKPTVDQNLLIESETTPTGNSVVKKLKFSNTDEDQGKVKFVMTKNGKTEEIIVNNIVNSNESIVVKGRTSRSSCRKSSIISVCQPREKGSVKGSDTFQNVPVNSEPQISMDIQGPEIVDGASSLEEEESQESDKSTYETQFNIMEVIFGPTPKPTQTIGRPVRNKTRPKRDSDFILGSPKEGDKEFEGKSSLNKKSLKYMTECKPTVDLSKKNK